MEESQLTLTGNGRKPINSNWAGKVYPVSKLPKFLRGKYPNGIPFTINGFPDFSRYSKKTIRLKSFLGREKDFIKADKLAGIPLDYRKKHNLTWHHHEDGKTMQLVPSDLHAAIRHTGGISIHGK